MGFPNPHFDRRATDLSIYAVSILLKPIMLAKYKMKYTRDSDMSLALALSQIGYLPSLLITSNFLTFETLHLPCLL